MLTKNLQIRSLYWKKLGFLGQKRRKTHKKQQELHCKTGLNLVFKMATKMTAQFGIIYAMGIMTTKQKS